ncbi:hypothetical protein BDF14DRAFT_1869766 [Spinellus fusiger]|nr:hypothetical protein BDF14DRAFT_1869766 [Spinellus fusiger]
MHLSIAINFLLCVTTFFQPGNAMNADRINQCPSLSPRDYIPKDVKDVRIDDIKVFGGLGDSVMAGFGMMGKRNGGYSIKDLLEYRGKNYAIGGDPAVNSLAGFTRRYQPLLKGYSTGQRFIDRCLDGPCTIKNYRPQVDHLNAAISGAIAKDLQSQLDYLIPEMKQFPGVEFENDWKLINIQIGSNDQCGLCTPHADDTTVEAYAYYVEEAIERIRSTVPNTIVNLIGNWHVSGLLALSDANPSYCKFGNKKTINLNPRSECPCLQSKSETEAMDLITTKFNIKLAEIAKKYEAKSDSFAVVFQPANLNLTSLPISAFSTLDCFHPSLLCHEYFAKLFWNSMFMPNSQKPDQYNYDKDLKIYCPIDDDRIVGV